MPVVAIVSGQWGNEGSGKIIDYLGQRARVMVRCQGGHNVEHTIINKYGEFHMRLLSASVFNQQMITIVGSGVMVNPVILLDEIEMLQRAEVTNSRLCISDRAHVIMPYHILIDRLDEEARGGTGNLLTRARGVREAYADKVMRMGITLSDLLNEESLLTKLSQTLQIKNRILQRMYNHKSLPLQDIYRQYLGYGNRLAKFIIETSLVVRRALDLGHTVVLEGTSGAMLDPDFGSYPHIGPTMSTAAGLAHGAGIGPNLLTHILGVFKVYSANYGLGPLPTQFGPDEEEYAEAVRKRGGEDVAVADEPVRVGWFDAVAARFVVQLNGMNALALSHLDVLDTLPEIKICVSYRVGETDYPHVPASSGVLQRVEPVYEVLPGWMESTSRARSMQELPPKAVAYVRRIEELLRCPLTLISVGRSSDLLQVRQLGI